MFIQQYSGKEQHMPTRLFYSLILLASSLLFIAGCSSGTVSDQVASNNNNPSISENPGQPPGSNGTPSLNRILLPTIDEPNTLGLQLARSTDGALHASYADKDGQVFYALCSTSCDQSTGWQSVVIDKVNVGFTGYAIPRLELDPQDRPRIVFHAAGGTFESGNTHFAECDTNCLSAGSWTSAAVLGHGGNMLEFRLAETDWFAIDPSGTIVIAYFLQNGLLDTDKRLRLLSCKSNCTLFENWSERIIATYSISLGRPVSIEIGPAGQFSLAVHIEGIGSDVATLTWFGCVSDCLENGIWSDGVSLETVESDLNSLPGKGLAVGSNGAPSILSFNDATQTSLTLHTCVNNCAQASAWLSQDVGSKISLPEGLYNAGYGVDARYDGDALEIVFAAKPSASPLRQLVVTSRCENNCNTASAVWTSRVIAQTNEILANQPPCIFIGTRVTSGLQIVPGAVGFTASPQWACGLEPLLVVGPDGEQSYDYAGDVRFLELSTVVSY